jgi:hypothetical protein
MNLLLLLDLGFGNTSTHTYRLPALSGALESGGTRLVERARSTVNLHIWS